MTQQAKNSIIATSLAALFIALAMWTHGPSVKAQVEEEPPDPPATLTDIENCNKERAAHTPANSPDDPSCYDIAAQERRECDDEASIAYAGCIEFTAEGGYNPDKLEFCNEALAQAIKNCNQRYIDEIKECDGFFCSCIGIE